MEVGSGVGEIESGEGARRWSVWPMIDEHVVEKYYDTVIVP